MSPKKKENKNDNIVPSLSNEAGSIQAKMNGLKLRAAIDTTVKKNLKADKYEARRLIRRLRERIVLNQNEAKLATACVNTQYKLLQRLFMLRVHESKEAIARLRKENCDLKAERDKVISAKDELINEKDEQIAKLESHLQSLHFQLERVVLEMVEKLENRLEEDSLNLNVVISPKITDNFFCIQISENVLILLPFLQKNF
ncbi:hypothetical protein EGR_04808 [Echinococcus granulosus]|uniref:Uncharacterized protein n=1 Tax=Echinococcus granulosus TaxID=6210 RepID=W6UH94_ECHGR|nr:hypothetical protein EGR_04808 [Echinococcus granulosus]EUB60426.1 hypothetical protein EGR_04808 [Echinococcus granulosus]